MGILWSWIENWGFWINFMAKLYFSVICAFNMKIGKFQRCRCRILGTVSIFGVLLWKIWVFVAGFMLNAQGFVPEKQWVLELNNRNYNVLHKLTETTAYKHIFILSNVWSKIILQQKLSGSDWLWSKVSWLTKLFPMIDCNNLQSINRKNEYLGIWALFVNSPSNIPLFLWCLHLQSGVRNPHDVT